MTERAPGGALAHPRVLLLGDPTLRPDGLERALVRGGFQVLESDRLPEDPPTGSLPDLVLLTVPDAGPGLAAAVVSEAMPAPTITPCFQSRASYTSGATSRRRPPKRMAEIGTPSGCSIRWL